MLFLFNKLKAYVLTYFWLLTYLILFVPRGTEGNILLVKLYVSAILYEGPQYHYVY